MCVKHQQNFGVPGVYLICAKPVDLAFSALSGISNLRIFNVVLAEDPVATRAAEIHTNRIIGVICPFLPPRVCANCLPIRMIGRGGEDRTHDLRLSRSPE